MNSEACNDGTVNLRLGVAPISVHLDLDLVSYVANRRMRSATQGAHVKHHFWPLKGARSELPR